MNRLSEDRRVLILRCLTDGCSMRATSRITGHARNTIAKLTLDLGAVCQEYQEKAFEKIGCAELQLDELWAFCGCKQKNLDRGKKGIGSIWTWLAIDSQTKLVPTWLVADRKAESCEQFISSLPLKANGTIHTDGYDAYEAAIDDRFGIDVNYGMVVKQYEKNRYIGSIRKVVTGQLDSVSTSFVERMNLTLRMSLRRYTRKTNGHSKSIRYHRMSLAIYLMVYNFARIHMTLRVSPAMAAGASVTLWGLPDVIGLLAN